VTVVVDVADARHMPPERVGALLGVHRQEDVAILA
jgi:hypothetical protein